MTGEQRDLLLVAAARYSTGGRGRLIRERAKMPQQEMAGRVGVSSSCLWRWENGKRRPREEAAVRWAQQLMLLEFAENSFAA